jgi:potassium/chloride transporter 4/5/6
LLRAISVDKVIPIFDIFAKNDFIPLMFTALISVLVIMIGDINVVAPILTMFFLLCYLFVNLSCFILNIMESPNWRPTWRFYNHKASTVISFIGILLCLTIMFMIGWYWALGSCALAFLLFIYILKQGRKNWGDTIQAMTGETALNALYKLERVTHVKNWRPHSIIL